MNKSVLIAIQPYYVFLIIARLMGWDIPQHKTVEVRKDCPKDLAWNKRVHIYCSKSKKSFRRIPKQYQPLMAKFLGKVVGWFTCDKICVYSFMNITPYPDEEKTYFISDKNLLKTCLSIKEFENYGDGRMLYGWHISDLKIYDKPKELGEFKPNCKHKDCRFCPHVIAGDQFPFGVYPIGCGLPSLTRPPMSWFYVDELSE